MTWRRNQLAGAALGRLEAAPRARGLHSSTSRKLLLLDEPTAGVDPKARREFWDEIHRLAAEGLTVLVTTHYMDEAERCHRIAYISYGNLLAQGTVDEVIEHPRPHDVGGERTRPPRARRHTSRHSPACEQVVAFGTTLHVSGRRRRPPWRKPSSRFAGRYVMDADQSGLEDVFIHLMDTVAGQLLARHDRCKFSLGSLGGRREGIHPDAARPADLRHDARHSDAPTDALRLRHQFRSAPSARGGAAADDGPSSRTSCSALQKQQLLFDFVRAGRKRKRRRTSCSREDRCSSSSTSRRIFRANCCAATSRSLLIEADATDPAATSYALGRSSRCANGPAPRSQRAAGTPQRAPPAPIDLRIHAHYNPEAITQYNIVPGLMGVMLTMTMVMITGLAITRERERGTMENLLSMPLRARARCSSARSCRTFSIGYIQVTVISGGRQASFSTCRCTAAFRCSWCRRFLFIVANLAVGITFSTVAKNQLQAMQMTFFSFCRRILLSGYMFPFRGMPRWAQDIGEILPLTHFLRIVRGILLKGNGMPEVARNLWPMVLFAAVMLTVGIKRYRQTLD